MGNRKVDSATKSFFLMRICNAQAMVDPPVIKVRSKVRAFSFSAFVTEENFRVFLKFFLPVITLKAGCFLVKPDRCFFLKFMVLFFKTVKRYTAYERGKIIHSTRIVISNILD